MKRVLIVDDSAFMRNALKFLIEKLDMEVVGMAGNGTEALELYRQLKPDLVTLDVLMPGMSGLDVLAALKKDWPEAKVVMITTLGQEEKQENAKKMGAAGYIRKPFSPPQVAEELDSAFGKKAA